MKKIVKKSYYNDNDNDDDFEDDFEDEDEDEENTQSFPDKRNQRIKRKPKRFYAIQIRTRGFYAITKEKQRRMETQTRVVRAGEKVENNILKKIIKVGVFNFREKMKETAQSISPEFYKLYQEEQKAWIKLEDIRYRMKKELIEKGIHKSIKTVRLVLIKLTFEKIQN